VLARRHVQESAFFSNYLALSTSDPVGIK
jgi:hypothetical protein